MEHSKCIQHVSIQLISWETHCKFDPRTWGDYNLGTFQMYPACSGLGKLESHGRGHLKCTQPIPTGRIGVTCCLYSQCIQHVPGGYLGPCPQCLEFVLGCYWERRAQYAEGRTEESCESKREQGRSRSHSGPMSCLVRTEGVS